jgi:UDP-N-acetylmuramyl pentapeptide synthase
MPLNAHDGAAGGKTRRDPESQGQESRKNPSQAAARALARTGPGDWILLKASRGMRLERVLEAMREKGAAA